MKKNHIITVFTLIALCISFNANAQESGRSFFQKMSISYHQSNLSKIGVAYHISDKFWTEARIYTYPGFDDFNGELIVCYNLLTQPRHNFYIGVGAASNYYEGVVLPLGFQFQPIKEFNQLLLHIEGMPTYDFSETVGFQSSFGFRYLFKG